MFRNRTSSQKPGVDFIANFRQSFPEVSGVISPVLSPTITSLGRVIAETPDLEGHQSLGSDGLKDLESTPRVQHEPWRFPPSLLDPNAFGFSPFASQPPGYYSPTPGSSSSQWHSQTADLNTPGVNIAMGLQTPLSLPASADTIPENTLLDMSVFNNQLQPQFPNYIPFSHNSDQQHHQSHSYAPSFLQHQEGAFDTLEHHSSSMDDEVCLQNMDVNIQHHQPVLAYQQTTFNLLGMVSMPSSAESFRFHVTLNAPTAMVKHPDEIPVTYLNKGQAYTFSIVDTASNLPLPIGTRYRTFVRISFEDEQQRQRPSTCWQLWKEGRGTNEAHQRGGKLQAVEYVESSQPSENDETRTRVELDTASFDGFSVIWTPGANGLAECSIAVRFNFLSTDFSHSKGVKGIPVRLCAKTQTLFKGSPPPHMSSDASEVAYCKVKLFRDHGAERKLANDVAHVKKTIDKLNQQIAQSESGMKDFGKRKRASSSSIKSHTNQRPGKVHKHKRTWSMSSASSSGGRLPAEEDLYHKLQTMNDMFTSTRHVSILYLRGSEQDDPDLYPVGLVGEPLDLTKVESRNNLWQQRSSDRGSTGRASSLVSLSPRGTSLQSQAIAGSAQTNSQRNWAEFNQMTPSELQSSNPQHLASPPDQLTKVAKADGTGNLNRWIEAIGVDPSYKAPIEQSNKAVACFYVALQDPNQSGEHGYYRAIYLMQRTLQEFKNCIASKWNLDPKKIIRILQILGRGLQVEVDDDIILGMVEGQDLVMEFVPVDIAINSDITNNNSLSNETYSKGLELRIIF